MMTEDKTEKPFVQPKKASGIKGLGGSGGLSNGAKLKGALKNMENIKKEAAKPIKKIIQKPQKADKFSRVADKKIEKKAPAPKSAPKKVVAKEKVVKEKV